MNALLLTHMESYMREGELYPELRRAVFQPTEMRSSRMNPQYWTNPDLKAIPTYIEDVAIPAVRITIPREDLEKLMSIYTAHYHAANQNPAVVEAWQQYRMLVALTEKSHPRG